MNPNDMTIEAIRDELARREGWVRYWPSKLEETWYAVDGSEAYSHPIPATLDEAAKLPEGWTLDYVDGLEQFVACGKKGSNRIHNAGDTELLARFRLRLACTLADEGSKT